MEIASTYKAAGINIKGHYGIARTAADKLGQTLYTRINGQVTVYWTGKTYRTMRKAMADSATLNA